MDATTAIVLGVGVATVGAQLFAAFLGCKVAGRQATAAEAQATAAEAASRRKLGAVLVVSVEHLAAERITLRIHNGGRFQAVEVLTVVLDDRGEALGETVVPVVPASQVERVMVSITPPVPPRSLRRVFLEWTDGLGRDADRMDLLGLPSSRASA
jgi:hypothetical protein